VMRTIPCGREMMSIIFDISPAEKPISSSGMSRDGVEDPDDHFSRNGRDRGDPQVEVAPPHADADRPSCGSRFSAMSILAMILIRDTTAPWTHFGRSIVLRRSPSTR